MKLEDQVVSLELAKRLKELGVKQESYFQWFDEGSFGSVVDRRESGNGPYGQERYAAFTVAELGELIFGSVIDGNKPNLGFRTFRDYKGKNVFGWDRHIDFSSDTEADARAKMLIYLLENKLCSPTSL